AHQEGRVVRHFATGVFDLGPLDGDTRRQAPKSDPRYYYRPGKTILVRTVAHGGESYYVQGGHRDTVAAPDHAALRAGAQHTPPPPPPPRGEGGPRQGRAPVDCPALIGIAPPLLAGEGRGGGVETRGHSGPGMSPSFLTAEQAERVLAAAPRLTVGVLG